MSGDGHQIRSKGVVGPPKNLSQINLSQDPSLGQKRHSKPDVHYRGGGTMSLILS